jgi:hypothetical protein
MKYMTRSSISRGLRKPIKIRVHFRQPIKIRVLFREKIAVHDSDSVSDFGARLPARGLRGAVVCGGVQYAACGVRAVVCGFRRAVMIVRMCGALLACCSVRPLMHSIVCSQPAYTGMHSVIPHYKYLI